MPVGGVGIFGSIRARNTQQNGYAPRVNSSVLRPTSPPRVPLPPLPPPTLPLPTHHVTWWYFWTLSYDVGILCHV